MIGVVLWSSRLREQAVIWCEDHAALAYLTGREQFVEAGWLDPGEMVELEDETLGELRHARAVRRLGEAPRNALPHMLASTAPARMVTRPDRVPAAALPPRRRSLVAG